MALTVRVLRKMLDNLDPDACVLMGISFEDGTELLDRSCCARAVRFIPAEGEAGAEAVILGTTSREELLFGPALPSIDPECLRWVADNRKPFAAEWVIASDTYI